MNAFQDWPVDNVGVPVVAPEAGSTFKTASAPVAPYQSLLSFSSDAGVSIGSSSLSTTQLGTIPVGYVGYLRSVSLSANLVAATNGYVLVQITENSQIVWERTVGIFGGIEMVNPVNPVCLSAGGVLKLTITIPGWTATEIVTYDIGIVLEAV